ncbi:hydroxymethylbilane synthase [Acidipila sp. EB88]|uniref:hydroxymethylbilane synthase n=1 Tax=Acidipila sp. EB88 TaxID=2305226 RepID=UPI000F5E9EC0|nr:hydroxymethylbilane synthase [Acidipila sp. EB88]RRA49444.1 hydroxymethylbilane synthase [Acidipila sp. EB88]
MSSGSRIRIGSRGSELAMWQAHHVAAALRGAGHTVEIEVIRTTGDRLQGVAFNKVGTKGMFTKEIEEALADGRVDLAVHSLKDLPTELHPAFALAALPRRADPRDAFVSKEFATFASLPPGARVGTSSLRRQSQLRAHRHDLQYVEFRGNVDTRLRKLESGEAEACILACAGLDRLERTGLLRERLSTEIVCPAAGQGALAIEVRGGDLAIAEALHFLDDAETRFAVTAERAALHALGGGCQVPIGIYCEQHQQQGQTHWQIRGSVLLPEGRAAVRVALEHRTEEDPRALGERLAEELLRQGAGALLAAE